MQYISTHFHQIMKRIFTLLSFVLMVIALLSNCKHEAVDYEDPNKDTTDTPIPNPPPDTTDDEEPNLKDSICFSDDVMPILASSCAYSGCHDDTTREEGINLSSYQNLKATISGALLLQIIQETGDDIMPPDPAPKLSSNQINTIKKWVEQGMKSDIDCIGPCDTSNITFAGVIYPIIENSCKSCHSGETITFNSYTDVKAKVDDGMLYCAITHGQDCAAMPKNAAPLSACKIKLIKKWIDSGAPNN